MLRDGMVQPGLHWAPDWMVGSMRSQWQAATCMRVAVSPMQVESRRIASRAGTAAAGRRWVRELKAPSLQCMHSVYPAAIFTREEYSKLPVGVRRRTLRSGTETTGRLSVRD